MIKMENIKDFTVEEKKEIMEYIDDFCYHMEDNFGCLHTEEMKRYGLDKIVDKLNKIYNKFYDDVYPKIDYGTWKPNKGD